MIAVPKVLRTAKAQAVRTLRNVAAAKAIASSTRGFHVHTGVRRAQKLHRSLPSTSLGVSSSRQFSAAPASVTGVTALQNKFKECKSQGRAAFVAYLTAGFPVPEDTVPALKAMQDNGADVIEIGVPFTDPLADGPTIQRANQRAIGNGINSVRQCLELTTEARAKGVHVPIVLMGYWNPFMQYEGDLLTDSAAAGVSGFIIVDMPPEEASAFRSSCTTHGLSYIPLVAPTTTDERLTMLTEVADSFIYAVSTTGVTGSRTSMDADLGSFVAKIQEKTNVPIAVGFGIGNQQNFRDVSEMADGVVVGSALINTLAQADAAGKDQHQRMADLGAFCKQISGREEGAASTAASQRETKNIDTKTKEEIIYNQDSKFGDFGGSYVSETLTHALNELDLEYIKCKDDPAFRAEVESHFDYIGRPSSFHKADRLTKAAGGAQIWLKREDLNHTGAHKINNAIAQCLLAKRIGKTRIIAETGAGQHGVATATICAKLGLPLTVYMGKTDVDRQMLNVFRMRLMGATVVPVDSGSCTLKDAINEAMRDWVTNIHDTHYLVGSAIGPHPFPTIVRDFQAVIGQETKAQCLDVLGKLPDALVACVGGGSNAIGFFYPFVDDKEVRLIGVEAGGDGVETGRHSATLTAGTPGVLHGTRTYLLQDKTGQIGGTKSISAGLDYPGVGPQHAHLKDIGRAEYVAVTDTECLKGFVKMSKLEGIIPALETSHALWATLDIAAKMPKEQNLVVCVSGRGDKDLDMVTKYLKEDRFKEVADMLAEGPIAL